MRADLPRKRFSVLGVPVDLIQISGVVAQIEKWIREPSGCRFIAVTGMHGVTEAQHDPTFKMILNAADMVVPDGMPLVWLARLKGHKLKRRVYGPELMVTFFESTREKGYRHFLYGGAPGVPERLSEILRTRFPRTVVAGTYSPPFGEATPEEDAQIVARINETNPDVVWVGLGTPKQERWMLRHRDLLRAAVTIGVGAAFDINAGIKKQAPRWMREHGLEWLFRLLQEPRRLWRRYLVQGSQFVIYLVLDFLGFGRSE
jgi:N-acetylglucosaminyldiphosphoundecaprenol N-acetyl-beta-D-mannosaminyltransferase